MHLALHLQLLTTLQLYHLPPPLPPPGSNSSCLFAQCQSLNASCCTVLLCISRCSTARLKMFYFLCLLLMYHLCEKYYKPIIVQYHIANCISWLRRLTSLDLRTNWTYECILGKIFIHMQGLTIKKELHSRMQPHGGRILDNYFLFVVLV